jgi:type IV pilus assembly protein PilA
MRHPPNEDNGFTLVELLTVIVIIGVLAAIAIPTLLNQRTKGYHAMMASDLHSVVTAELALIANDVAPTGDPTALAGQGYRQSQGVTLPHVKVLGAGFLACLTHPAAGEWLVYDSTTGSTSSSASDCA